MSRVVHVPRQRPSADRKLSARRKRTDAAALAGRCWRCGTPIKGSTLAELEKCYRLAREAAS